MYLSDRDMSLSQTQICLPQTQIALSLTQRVQNPQKLSRMGSPWLRLSSNSARMNPTASKNLFKPLPALREPTWGPYIYSI